MEKIKTDQWKLDKKHHMTFFSWKFANDERDQLQQALQKFEPEAVKQFIYDLELFCDAMKFLLKQRNPIDAKTEKRRILNRFQKAMKELNLLIGEMRLWDRHETITEILIDSGVIRSDDVGIRLNEKEKIRQMLWDTWLNLGKLTDIIKNTSKRSGRPKADEAGFVQGIAKIYEHYLGKPKTYKGGRIPGSGPFYNVVIIALNAVGISIDDPSRHITKALK